MSYVTVFGLLCLAVSIQTELTTKTPYIITVKTGTKFAAGTDATVFMKLNGLKGTTSKVVIEDKNATYFEMNCADHFIIMDDDVGQITSIEIGHDNSGIGPGWFLDNVEVAQVIGVYDNITEVPSLIKTRFDLQEWIPKDEKSKKLVKIITATSTETKPI
ncbi:lipoxygenase homology domain-containing protein 1-like isoform X1 [Physella acuta]|uniref:lipoxygenase homology domain-containing protein 1-like isoform X1 n=1 Tax=Physella acuta TaxID=109671 RepID=UPI0027DB1DF8|nr:lipoxygenase homology domain-containing protein 1-like isoform X1 [Physella acuta]